MNEYEVESYQGIYLHISCVIGFFTAIVDLGASLFPFVPAEWLAIIEAALIVLVIGVIIKRRVF